MTAMVSSDLMQFFTLINRTRRIFKQLKLEDYRKVHLQVIGAEDTYGPHAAVGDVSANTSTKIWWDGCDIWDAFQRIPFQVLPPKPLMLLN